MNVHMGKAPFLKAQANQLQGPENHTAGQYEYEVQIVKATHTF